MKTLAAMAAFLLLTSCGTMFSKGGADLMITSRPSGAEITLDGTPVGMTPAQIHVAQNAKGKVTVELAGYVTMARKIPTTIQPATFLNLFWGYLALPFFLIDAASGNVTDWNEAPLYFKLQKEQQ